jgi:hypothetical protein
LKCQEDQSFLARFVKGFPDISAIGEVRRFFNRDIRKSAAHGLVACESARFVAFFSRSQF